jgi:hypothetical protein
VSDLTLLAFVSYASLPYTLWKFPWTVIKYSVPLYHSEVCAPYWRNVILFLAAAKPHNK